MNTHEIPAQDGGDVPKISTKSVSEQTGTHDMEGASGRPGELQRIVIFSEIAGGTCEVIIEHEGQKYRLRATRNGRLLLNK